MAAVTQTLHNKTERTIHIKWSLTEGKANAVWYSIDGGSSWTQISNATASGGDYVISGLQANTSYSVRTRVRQTTGGSLQTSTMTVKTYNYPYCTSMPDFMIGDKVQLEFYNPLGREFTFSVIANGQEITSDTWTISKTSYAGINASRIQDLLYQSIPNQTSATYKIKCVFAGQTITKTGGTYIVDRSKCTPVIGSATYQDTNSQTISLTGNNQKIIQNRSTVRYTAGSLSAKNHATVSGVKVKVNGSTYTLSASGSNYVGGNAVINSASDVSAVFTITDSRGITGTKTINISMLAWKSPTANISIKRVSNFYTETTIKASATYSSLDGANSVTITYAAKKKGASTWEQQGTLTNGVATTLQLDNQYEWQIGISVTDVFVSTTYTGILSRGIPLIFFDRKRSSVGINCIPENDNSLEVNGDQFMKIDGGRVAAQGAISGGSVSSDIQVNFNKVFTSAPNVLVCFDTNSSAPGFGACTCVVLTGSVTTTGFKIRWYNGDTASRNPGFRWIAVGV